MAVHERLKYAREKIGLTQKAASEASDIGVSSLSEFESGKREPRLPQLQKLATLYHCSLAFFLDDAPLPVEMVLWREKPTSASGRGDRRLVPAPLQAVPESGSLVWGNGNP